MKFLIQKCDNKIVYDFSFTLMESIKYQNWLRKKEIKVKYLNTINDLPIVFMPFHREYVPIGSVEFVSAHLKQFYNIIPKPINVPEELFCFADRKIFNGTDVGLKNSFGKAFVKSNDNIKDFTEIVNDDLILKQGNYQISELISINSEWRVFVYRNTFVGLQNYCGQFTLFPNVETIELMIKNYKSAPVAYTLDIGVNDNSTFVIECHSFFSVGLYGFRNHGLLCQMFNQAYKELIKI
jgi:hypothetical protein